MSITEPSLSDAIEAGIQRLRAGVRVAIPAIVVEFARTPYRHIRAKVAIRAVLQTGETVDYPELERIPVLIPCGGGFAMDFDLEVGEEVLLLVCDRAISEWKIQGGIVSQQIVHMHALSDAVAIPGLYSQARPQLQTPGVGTLYLGSSDGDPPWMRLATVPTAAVTVEAPAIALGATASLGVARLTDSVAPSVSMATWMGAVVTALTGLGASPGLPPTTIGAISSASTVVRSA